LPAITNCEVTACRRHNVAALCLKSQRPSFPSPTVGITQPWSYCWKYELDGIQLSWSCWPQCTDVCTIQTKLNIEHTSVGLTHAHPIVCKQFDSSKPTLKTFSIVYKMF